MAVMQVNTAEFKEKIAENKLVLVDFFATWCGPCKMVAPLLDAVSDEFAGRALVLKVDVDEEQELAEEFGITSIPTVILFKDGEPISTQVGAHQKDFYVDLIEMHL